MTSAKKGEEESRKKAVFGRTSSHNLKMGIVGLPNVGKSSLFNTMTGMQVPAANYAFCTIDPSEARVLVKDDRFTKLCEIYKPKKEIPAHLTVFDIAGLVKGASEGLGMGNSFLEHIRQVDGIFHVIRCFENDEVTHVEDSVDPIRDQQIISSELRMKDLADAKKKLEGARRDLRSSANDKVAKLNVAALEKLIAGLEDGKDARTLPFTVDEVRALKPLNLITAKNVVYLANISRDKYVAKKSPTLAIRLKKHLMEADSESKFVVVCADITEEEAEPFISKAVDAGYKSLDLSNFFTCGPKEVRSWTIREGTLAPDAGAVIHTDFRTGFVAVDVISYDDLASHGSEQEVKAKGLCKLRGRDYPVTSGDILRFRAGKVNK